MIDFREVYKELSDQRSGNQKKISVDSCIEVFFGYSFEGKLRLSFMSKTTHPTIESTTILRVVQGREDKNIYWTSFDLLDEDMKEAYFSFCENLIDSIIGVRVESEALNLLKRRFISWKKLFQKVAGNDISREKAMGVFGELMVLKDIIAPLYGIDTAIQSWGGPDMLSKDFTLNRTWYEVKTISSTADSIHISSLSQLSSNNVGHLVVVRVEMVSPEVNVKCSAIIDIIKEILLKISDESVEDLFIKKIQGIGIDIYGKEIKYRFDIKAIKSYSVTEGFPRITLDNVPYSEITDVNYKISEAAIGSFAEE